MLITTRSDSARARSTRLRCPRCSAPIVGTNPIRDPSRLAIAARSSAIPHSRRRLVAVLGIGILAFSYLVRVLRNGLARRLGEICVLLQEPGSKAVVQSKQIGQDEHLSVTMRTSAYADCGDGDRRSDLPGNVCGKELENNRKGSRALERNRFLRQSLRVALLPSL